MKNLLLSFCGILSISFTLIAQDVNNVQLEHIKRDHGRKEIQIPNILGYQTLKCDFHMHTIFSDGTLWPEVRVQEAWEEGLDAIAITDHIENQPSKPFIGGDHNSSYDVSVEKAKQLDIILIKGGEITRSMPPGHLNALFLNDVNKLKTETPFQAIEAAIEQGAFIQWNHPGWKAQQPDTCMWWPEHGELHSKGWLHGIEVFNGKEWYPIALDWCLEKDLTVIANSDIHGVNGHYYDIESGTRPVTLVFSETRSLEGIKEAMFDQRTVAYFDNKLVGKEVYIKAIFDASLHIELSEQKDRKGRLLYTITNISDITYLCEFENGKKLNILANRSIKVPVPEQYNKNKIMVNNLLVSSGKKFETTIVFPE